MIFTDGTPLQFVNIARVLQVINNDLVVDLSDPLAIEEILNLHEIHAHLLGLLEEFFAELSEEFWRNFWLRTLTIQCGSAGQLLLNGLFLFLLEQFRGDAFALHEAK